MRENIIRIKLSVILLGIIFFGTVVSAVTASPNYELTLAKGTTEYSVDQYDDTAWKDTINPSSSPTAFFEGDANVTGAKSKQTIKGWVDTTYSTYDALVSLYFSLFEFISWNAFSVNFTEAGYNETSINENYPETFDAWYGISAEWWFTDGNFPETPNNTMSPIIIMKNPLDYKIIIDNCNAIIEDILNDPEIDWSIKFLFSNKSADNFLWQMVFYGFGVATPQPGYLNEVVTELGCEVTTTSGSTLIFERNGVTNYTVEVSYGSKGTLSTFEVQDADGDLIYLITSSDTDWIFFTILFSVIAIAVVVIIYSIIRNRKLKK